jgi:hypothetical protein
MNISRYVKIDKFVNIRYIFLLACRAYSWLFQLAQNIEITSVGLVDFLTPVVVSEKVLDRNFNNIFLLLTYCVCFHWYFYVIIAF